MRKIVEAVDQFPSPRPEPPRSYSQSEVNTGKQKQASDESDILAMSQKFMWIMSFFQRK